MPQDVERDFTELKDILGDAMDIAEREDIDEYEVLDSARFGTTEMEDVLDDALDEMGYNDND